MENINEVIEVLNALGYNPKHNKEKKDIHFVSHGFDDFPERHKNAVRALLGKQLMEFYYGGDTQHIYYRAAGVPLKRIPKYPYVTIKP